MRKCECERGSGVDGRGGEKTHAQIKQPQEERFAKEKEVKKITEVVEGRGQEEGHSEKTDGKKMSTNGWQLGN